MEIGTDRDRLASELDAVLAKGKTFHQCRLRHENVGAKGICKATVCQLRLGCAHQSAAGEHRIQSRAALDAAISFLEEKEVAPK